MRLSFFLALALTGLIQSFAIAQSTYPVNPDQDILHYTFHIALNDSTNEIAGTAVVVFNLKDTDRLVFFDPDKIPVCFHIHDIYSIFIFILSLISRDEAPINISNSPGSTSH